MNPQLYFWLAFLLLWFFIIILDRKWCMLRDISNARQKPYSFSRVQLAWWTAIIIASVVSIAFSRGALPTLLPSTVILLGLSTATTAAGRVIDLSAQSIPGAITIQDQNSENFFLDILSDANGVGIHRFQVVAFNLVFGVWFIATVLHNLTGGAGTDAIIPDIGLSNLALLTLSSGTYAAIKTTENKPPQIAVQAAPDEIVRDEAIAPNMKAEG